MGGRVAEEIIFNVQTSGASKWLEQATQLARAMVTEYGGWEKLGPVQYEVIMRWIQDTIYCDKSYSAHTAQLIDEEIWPLLVGGNDKAVEIINANRETCSLQFCLAWNTWYQQVNSMRPVRCRWDSWDSEEDNQSLSTMKSKKELKYK